MTINGLHARNHRGICTPSEAEIKEAMASSYEQQAQYYYSMAASLRSELRGRDGVIYADYEVVDPQPEIADGNEVPKITAKQPTQG